MDYLLNIETPGSVDYFSNVLNLIINGLPSKLSMKIRLNISEGWSFKPYYKWITF